MIQRKTFKIVFLTSILLSLSFFIAWIFWKQEVQYALPTPVPSDFADVAIGEKIDLSEHLKVDTGEAVLLHFFNSSCPCSRFNMQEFERLSHLYQRKVKFYVVIQSDDKNEIQKFIDKYELDVPVVLDPSGTIADKCGIYATPQAVILDQQSRLYFKGNYNKARFCTQKESRFAEIAIDYLLKREPLPLFMQYAVADPYGCSLPSDEKENHNLISFF